MPSPDIASPPRSRPVLGIVRLIGALAVLLIAAIAALVVLDVLPDEVLSTYAMKIVIVAGIAAAAVGLVSVLLPSRRD
jgi:hypothetical protein